MQFEAKEYYQASLERMKEARKIYTGGSSYALAMYCGGLAVECLLRAFRWKKDKTFEGRHDLGDLFKASRFLKIDDEYLRDKGASDEAIRKSGATLHATINLVGILWHNSLRFASEAKLKKHLHQLDRLKGIKKDPLKKNALDLLNHAQTLIDRGVVLWT